MKSILAFIPLLSVWLQAAASAPPATVLLETAIRPTATAGDIVALRDKQCRYSGQLVRASFNEQDHAASADKVAGVPMGRWQINILLRTCGNLTLAVKMRAGLPGRPSSDRRGGFPALPTGYEAGTAFEVSPTR